VSGNKQNLVELGHKYESYIGDALRQAGYEVHYIGMLFGGAASFANGASLFYLRNNLVLLVVCAIACTPIAQKAGSLFSKEKLQPFYPVLVLAGLLICTAFIVDASYNPFLYFRF
jgi:alginate O-acetyltransferase complex protein AlgI